MRVLRPHVVAWEWRGPSWCHWGERITVDVEPTTVEEYRILVAIGEAMGVDDMPAISLEE